MTDWVERDAAAPRVAEWLHAPTGVELFVREAGEDYGVCITAPPSASIDAVSIGDPETGQFRAFDDRSDAVSWADDWKDTDVVRRALNPGQAADGGDPPS